MPNTEEVKRKETERERPPNRERKEGEWERGGRFFSSSSSSFADIRFFFSFFFFFGGGGRGGVDF